MPSVSDGGEDGDRASRCQSVVDALADGTITRCRTRPEIEWSDTGSGRYLPAGPSRRGKDVPLYTV